MPVALRWSPSVFRRAFVAKWCDREFLLMRSYQTVRGKAISYRRERVALDNKMNGPGAYHRCNRSARVVREYFEASGSWVAPKASSVFGPTRITDENHAPSAIEGQRLDVTGIACERG